MSMHSLRTILKSTLTNIINRKAAEEIIEEVVFLDQNSLIKLTDIGICEHSHCGSFLFLEGISSKEKEEKVWICPRCKNRLTNKSLKNLQSSLLAITGFRLAAAKRGLVYLYKPREESSTAPSRVYYWKPSPAIMVYNGTIIPIR